MARLMALLILPLILCACGTTSSSEFCLVSSPIRPSTADVLTDGTVAQLLKHNKFGMKACGWRP